jgi:hypothetical protein
MLANRAQENNKNVIFRKKSDWQKKDCFANQEGCKGEATLEAVCGNSLIRCCKNEKCKNRATEIAIL